MSCNFGLLRASRRLLETAFDRRLGYARAMQAKRHLPVVNDEAFLATLACNLPGFTAASFDTALAGGASTALFRGGDDPVAHGGAEFAVMTRSIVHPVRF